MDEQRRQRINDLARAAYPSLDAGYLYGSFAGDTTRESSDVDLANHVIREEKLGIPRDSGESFGLLAASGRLDTELAGRLPKMGGSRNTVVHQYQDVDIQVVVAMIDHAWTTCWPSRRRYSNGPIPSLMAECDERPPQRQPRP